MNIFAIILAALSQLNHAWYLLLQSRNNRMDWKMYQSHQEVLIVIQMKYNQRQIRHDIHKQEFWYHSKPSWKVWFNPFIPSLPYFFRTFLFLEWFILQKHIQFQFYTFSCSWIQFLLWILSSFIPFSEILWINSWQKFAKVWVEVWPLIQGTNPYCIGMWTSVLQLTAWRMFHIDPSLVLSFTSALVSFTILFLALKHNKHFSLFFYFFRHLLSEKMQRKRECEISAVSMRRGNPSSGEFLSFPTMEGNIWPLINDW